MSDSPRRTALFERHRALGGRIVPFGGFEMPLQYGGIFSEHAAVRTRAGLFDVSHMAQFEARGSEAGAWLDALTVGDVASLRPGRVRYTVFTDERGGALDDTLVYRYGDRWMVVANAANAGPMWDHLAATRPADVTLANRHGESGLLALQGPRAAAILAPLTALDLSALRTYACAEGTVAGIPTLVSRTGYTGEDGFELFADAAELGALWDALLQAGGSEGLVPCGLGARDILRLEAGMPLYGHELGPDITPLQAGLGRIVRFEKPAFPGKAALLAQAQADDYPRIAGLILAERIPARPGYSVRRGDVLVGEIRSGAIAPAVGDKSIATALVERSAATVGTPLTVQIRGTERRATVVELPFYRRRNEER